MATLASDPFNFVGVLSSLNWSPELSGTLPHANNGVAQDSTPGVFQSGLYVGTPAVSWPTDQWAMMPLVSVVSNTSNYAGILLRGSPSVATNIRVFVQGPLGATATLNIAKIVGGSFTALAGGTANFNIQPGAVLYAGVQGNYITAIVGNLVLNFNNTAGDVVSGTPGFVLNSNTLITDAQVGSWSAGSFLGSSGYALESSDYF